MPKTVFKKGEQVRITVEGHQVVTSSETLTIAHDPINRAEAKLSSITRKDWVAIYSDLDDNIKQFLADYCSSKAAKEAINYDMSGYTSRVEAQTMLDVNDDIANEALKELNNKIVTDWMVDL